MHMVKASIPALSNCKAEGEKREMFNLEVRGVDLPTEKGKAKEKGRGETKKSSQTQS